MRLNIAVLFLLLTVCRCLSDDALDYFIENNEVTVIGIDPFDERSILVIPDTIEGHPVVHIGEGAFEGGSFDRITLPDSIKTIGDSAFAGLSQFPTTFRSINIPASLESIGQNAFARNPELRGSFSLPPSCTTIGRGAFEGCSSIEAITIQAPINILPQRFAFGCRSLKFMILPDTVTLIAEASLMETGLEEIDLPSSLSVIAPRAFRSSEVLTRVIIPRSVATISTYAFADCSSLAEVEFQGNASSPSQLRSIFSFAFSGCVSLQKINLPEGLLNVERYAFSGCDLRNGIELPESLETVGEGAFFISDHGINISATPFFSRWELVVPPGVQTLGEQAFGLNKFLGSIEMRSVIPSIPARTFGYCQNLQTVSLPEGVLELGSKSFISADKLRNITLPDSLQICGEKAFAICRVLESVQFGSNLTEIGEKAFNDCPELSQIRFLGAAPTTVGENAFSNIAEGARALVLEEYLASFGGAGALWNGLLVEANSPVIDPYVLTYVIVFDSVVITGCDSSVIGTLRIPDTIEGHPVVGINDNAFLGCTGIEHIVLPETIRTIGRFAFYNCDKLQSINLPEGITVIQDYAFGFCGNLVSIDLPSTLTSIGEYAFTNCSALSRITLPEGLDNLGRLAFQDCDTLSEITFLGAPPSTVGASPFFRISPEATLLISANQLEAFGGVGALWNGVPVTLAGSQLFPSVLTWEIVEGTFVRITACDTSAAGNLIVPEELAGLPVQEIADAAFASCDLLTSLSLPDSLTTIGSDAFALCTSLKAIELSSNLQSLGSGAFSQCRALTSIRLPDSLTSIQHSTFRGCSTLSLIVLPAGLTSVSTEAFRECLALQSITFPESLVSIRHQVFSGSTALTEVIFDGAAPSPGDQPFQNVNASAVVKAYPEHIASFGGAGATWEGLPVQLRDPRTFTVASVSGKNGGVTGFGIYQENDFATLTATPEPGYVFLNWEGDDTSNFNPLTIIVEADTAIHPVFILEENYDTAFGIGRDSGEFLCEQAIANDPNAFGYFTANQIHNLSGAPALQRQEDGTFTMTLGMRSSPDLTGFTPFDLTGSTPFVNAQGEIVIPFSSEAPAAFFQLNFAE